MRLGIRNKPKPLTIIILILFTVYTITNVILVKQSKRTTTNNPTLSPNNDIAQSNAPDEIIDFEDFDHINGHPTPIVPNIVHLLYLNNPIIDFDQMICILSIFLNHGPDKIYLHCSDCSFTGKYFEAIQSNKDLWKRIVIHPVKYHKTIFGQAYSKGWAQYHASDTLRLAILMHYGGIYFDKDVYVVQSLKKYFYYEMVVSWDKPFSEKGIGSQVMIANRNARLLKSYYDQYRVDFRKDKWYYNGGMAPAKILLKFPQLAHVVEDKFGTQSGMVCILYKGCDPDAWRNYATIHTLIRHRAYMDKNSSIRSFNEVNIWTYDKGYGRMARDVLKRANLFMPKDKHDAVKSR